MEPIILASSSPRRDEILTKFNIPHIIKVKETKETFKGLLPPKEEVKDVAYAKALAVDDEINLILAADTIVVLDDKILGKPKDNEEAFAMLKTLQGRFHFVYTGVALIKGDKHLLFTSSTKVYFKKMSDEQIKTYIDNVYLLDKAGAYAIQDPHTDFILKYEGSYYNIMGLPIEEILDSLKTIDS